MKKAICLLISAVLMSAVTCFAESVPTGFSPLSDMKNVMAKAALEGKLVVLVVRGTSSDAAYMDAGFRAGMNAVGGGVEKIFSRPDEINSADTTDFPQALKNLLKKRSFTSGSVVIFVVFDPKMTKVFAEVDATDMVEDRKLSQEFKKKVQEAKKTLK